MNKLEVLFSIGFFFSDVTRDKYQTEYTFLFSIHCHFILERLSPQQRLQIVQLYHVNRRSVKSSIPRN